MEQNLIKACLHSRSSYSLIDRYLAPDKYSREFKYLYKFITEYYQRDRATNSVDPPVLKAQIAETLENDKHIERFHNMIDSAVGSDVSVDNITAVILMGKQHELSIGLATALANNDSSEKIDALITSLQEVRAATSLSDLDTGSQVEVLENIDATQLVVSRLQEGNLLKVYPLCINDKLDGGLEGGDHVVLFGQTEIGKSAFSIQAASGFAYQGAPGLYIGNEDKSSRIAQRFISCLSGMNKYQIEANPEEAQRKALTKGLGNIRVIGLTPGTIPQLEALVEKYSPKWMVVDQIRNLATASKGNKVVQLEEGASGVRTLAKAANLRAISVTQAGDSAENKIHLTVGDVDFSNVGIPGTADVMIGIGANEEMLRNNERGVSLPKNKLSGDHARMVVKLQPALSRVVGS